jgi:formylglycine-generating enzyme required for sulfatase activity
MSRVKSSKHLHAADWLSEARLGAFMHFLPGIGSGPAAVAGFDVEALAEQLEWMGARYFTLTLGQMQGWLNSPNAAYDRIAGYRPGERCSTRDLPLDLHRALSVRGIRLMLYLPIQPPYRDPRAQHGFGVPPGHADQPIDAAVARKWGEVIHEWSVRYGEGVSGWWFDGAYPDTNFNEEIAGIYASAVKRGNPKAIVAFNPGIMVKRHAQAEDYTAGELNDPLDVVPTSRLVDGAQWHCLTFLGSYWGSRNTRYSAEQWQAWLKKVYARGGAVTLDMGPNMNPEAAPIGAITTDQATQFRILAQLAAEKGKDAKGGKAPAHRTCLRIRSASRSRRAPTLPTAWPFDAKEARQRQAAYAKLTGLPIEHSVDLGRGMKLELVLIPPGEFQMGSPADERGRDDDEVQRLTTLSKGFYFGKYPVTQAQWDAVMGSNPSKFKGQHHPVDQANWDACQALIKQLNAALLPPITDHRSPVTAAFRLPTEAEWEYACRAGTGGAYAGILDEMAWHDGNSGAITHAVGQKKPNAWGLYDLHGNVWEWCADGYHNYPACAVTDPVGIESGRHRVIRGGSWISDSRDCRSAERNWRIAENRNDDIGCRLAFSQK